MSSFVSLTEVQTRLSELLDQMLPGQKLFVTDVDGRIVASFVKEAPPRAAPRQPGTATGRLVIVADDQEHLQDFAEYLE
jgi:antitoxin (DNA-binding transcriptional repressor) of toxin-antitoxin stability system